MEGAGAEMNAPRLLRGGVAGRDAEKEAGMAENGNRGPNDFRSRNVRKRREPPIIDASATEVPVDPVEPAAEPSADAAPLPAAEPQAHEAEAATPEASDGPGMRETAEPVLFGSALRDPSPPTEPQESSEAAPEPAPADAVPPSPTAAADEERPAAAPLPERAVPPAAVPPAAVPPARSGGGAAWLLGLSNLVLLAALAWTLYTAPQRDGHAELADLRDKVAALEARPDPSQLQAGVAALDKRLGAADADRAALADTVGGLNTRLDAVAQTAQGAKADADKAASAAGAAQSDATKAAPAPTGAAAVATVGALAALAARVEGVDKTVSTLSADQARTAKAVADLPKPVPPDFGPVDARVATVESQLSGKVAGLGAQLTALDGKSNGSDARLNGFDAKVNAVDGKINGFDARMNAFEARSNGLESKLNGTAADVGKLQAAVAGLPKVDLSPLQASTATLGAEVARMQGQLSAAKDGTRVTEIRAVGDADEARATPIALVGQAVGRAVADGRPYAADLDTLKALGADPEAVAKLQPLAAGGAPTAGALKARWDAVSGDVLAVVKPAQAGNALDRLGVSALSLVQVHRVGAVEGDDPGALVTQIDAALDGGDVPGALAAWTKLPPAGQDRSKDWAAAARARVEAAGAAQGLVGRAIATLGRTRG